MLVVMAAEVDDGSLCLIVQKTKFDIEAVNMCICTWLQDAVGCYRVHPEHRPKPAC